MPNSSPTPIYSYRSDHGSELKLTNLPAIAESYTSLQPLLTAVNNWVSINTEMLPFGQATQDGAKYIAQLIVLLALEPALGQTIVLGRQAYDSEVLPKNATDAMQVGGVQVMGAVIDDDTSSFSSVELPWAQAVQRFELPNETQMATWMANACSLVNYFWSAKYRPAGFEAWTNYMPIPPASNSSNHQHMVGFAVAWLGDLVHYGTDKQTVSKFIDLLGRINKSIVTSLSEHFRLALQSGKLTIEEKDGTSLAGFISQEGMQSATVCMSWAILAVEGAMVDVDLNNSEVI